MNNKPKRICKSYTQAERKQAVDLAAKTSYRIAGQQLGISPTLIGTWKKRLAKQKQTTTTFPLTQIVDYTFKNKPSVESLQTTRLSTLQDELSRVRTENIQLTTLVKQQQAFIDKLNDKLTVIRIAIK